MKKLLLVVLLALGAYVVATDSGKLQFARAWGFITDRPAVELDFKTLSSRLDEKEIVRQFSSIRFKCEAENTELGDRVCYGNISSFNNVPAQYAAFFFKAGSLFNVKFAIKSEDHAKLVDMLKARYGKWESDSARRDKQDYAIVTWTFNTGTLAINEVGYGAESTVFWISSRAL